MCPWWEHLRACGRVKASRVVLAFSFDAEPRPLPLDHGGLSPPHVRVHYSRHTPVLSSSLSLYPGN